MPPGEDCKGLKRAGKGVEAAGSERFSDAEVH